LILNAAEPAGFSLGFGEICQSSTTADGSVDHANDVAKSPVQKAAHCPLCVAPAFGLLPRPTSPGLLVRQAPGIAFEVAAPRLIRVAGVTSAHRARAPPARAQSPIALRARSRKPLFDQLPLPARRIPLQHHLRRSPQRF